MNGRDNFSFSGMKENISKAGNLFYQYRACKRDVATIYDIENIRHGVVYARTPLQMNDPFDSMIGFSVDAIYSECLDLAFAQIEYGLDSKIELIIKNLLKQRMLGQMAEFVNALNAVKKHILKQSLIAHVNKANLPMFILSNINMLYGKSSGEIKKYFNKDTFLAFALLIKDYQNEDIEEKTIIEILQIEDVLKEVETEIIGIKEEKYIPFLKDFLSRMTVTCFSASGWDNQLMWSHYANAYSGICVEYDFGRMDKFIGFMGRVDYSNIRPTVLLKDLGITTLKRSENGNLMTEEVNTSALIDYLLTKNQCWSYEEEWRIINIGEEPYTPAFIEVPFIKSITLGLDLDDVCKQLLWDVCQERNIECYQLVISSSDYSLGRELLTGEPFSFNEEKDAKYINLVAEHMVPLGEKISFNCNALTKLIEEGKFEAELLINVLTYTLDYLCDAYFLKSAFNRYCKYTDTNVSEVSGNTSIGIAVSQIDDFICQSKVGIKMVESSLFNIRLMNKITPNELNNAKKFISDINEMFEKHNAVKWFGARHQTVEGEGIDESGNGE